MENKGGIDNSLQLWRGSGLYVWSPRDESLHL